MIKLLSDGGNPARAKRRRLLLKRWRRDRKESRAAEVYRKSGKAKLCLIGFLVATLALPPNATAAAITWTGSSVVDNTSYKDPTNWSCPTCGVATYPNNTLTQTFDASIGAGGQTYTTNVDTSATINSMTTGANTTLNILGGNTLTLGTGSAGVVLSSGGALNIDQSGQLNLADASSSFNTGSISVNGNLTIGAGTTLTLSGGLTNNGNIYLNSAGNTSTLSFSNGGTLTGSGTLTMSDNANNLVDIGAGQTLVNDLNHTIQGAGAIGSSSAASFTNNGSLNATSILGNALIVNATLTNWDGTNLNGGNYSASATLQLNSIVQSNNLGGNQIAALMNNANVAISGSAGLLTGDGANSALGTLSTITDSSLTFANATATITPGTGTLAVSNDGNVFGAASSLNVLAGGNLTVSGSLTNTVGDFANSSTIMVAGSSTLNVTGAFSQTTSAFAGGQASVTLDGASMMTIGGSFTQDALSALTLSGGSTLTAAGLSNAGTITVNDSSVADFRTGTAGGFTNLSGGALQGGSYDISGTFFHDADPVTAGGITALQGANVTLRNSGQMLFGGAQGTAGTADLTNLNTIQDSNLALYSSSTLTSITPGGTLLVSGVNNNSSLLIDGTNLQVNGAVSLQSAGPNTPSASLTVQNSSNLTATGAYSQTSNTTTTVSGGSTLFASGFSNGGTISVDATSTADFSVGGGPFQNLNGGSTLTGGTYNVAGTFNYAGAAISALNQANVSLTDSGQMFGTGGAASFTNLNAITDSSLTLNNSTAVTSITPGGTLAILSDVGQTSSLTLNGGSLQINGNVTNTGAASSVNVLGGGTVTTTRSFTQTGGSTLVGSTTFQGTIPAGAGFLTVRGTFSQSAGSLLQVEDGGMVTANGLSNAGSSQIFVDATSTADFRGGTFQNLNGGSTLTGGSYKIAGQFLFDGGPITTIATGTSVDLVGAGMMKNAGGDALGGHLLNNAGTLTLEAGAKFSTGTGTFNNSGTTTLLGGSSLTVAGSFTNTGTLNVGSVLETAPGSKEQFTSSGFTNNGVVVVGFGSKATVGTLNNLNSGTLQGGTYAIDGTFQYTGGGIQSIGTGTTLSLDARRTATDASVTDTAGTDALAGLQDVAGTLALSGNQSETVGNGAADFTVDASGALLIGAGINPLNSYTGEGGNGSLTIDTSLTSAGNVTVGNASQVAVGTLVVDGSFTQTGGDTTADGSLTVTGGYDEGAAGTLIFDLNAASVRNDTFTVDGNATLNGILDINLVNGYMPTLTGRPLLTLLTFGSLSGDFSSLELSINGVRTSSFGNNLTLTEIKTATSIELEVAPIPEPSTWLLLALGLAAFGSLEYRRRIQ